MSERNKEWATFLAILAVALFGIYGGLAFLEWATGPEPAPQVITIHPDDLKYYTE